MTLADIIAHHAHALSDSDAEGDTFKARLLYSFERESLMVSEAEALLEARWSNHTMALV